MGRCKKKISNRANGEVRGLHTSFGASEKKKKAAEKTEGGKYLPLPDTSQAYYAPNPFAGCATSRSTFSRGRYRRYSIKLKRLGYSYKGWGISPTSELDPFVQLFVQRMRP